MKTKGIDINDNQKGLHLYFPADQNYYGAEQLLVDAKKAGVRHVQFFDSDATLLTNYGAWDNATKPATPDGSRLPDPPVPVENSAQYKRGFLDYRVLTMNEKARETIEKARQDSPKGLIIANVGDAHAQTSVGTIHDGKTVVSSNIPGVGDMVGGQQIIIETHLHTKPPLIRETHSQDPFDNRSLPARPGISSAKTNQR